MSNSFEDKMDYLSGLTEYVGMSDFDALLKDNAAVFASCVLWHDGEDDTSTVTSEQMEALWQTVCTHLGMDHDKEYLDYEGRPDGDAFVIEYYERKME